MVQQRPFRTQTLIGPGAHELWVANGRTEDDNALLCRGFTATPNVVAQLRYARRGGSGRRGYHSSFSEVGHYAAVGRDGRDGVVQGVPGLVRRGHDPELARGGPQRLLVLGSEVGSSFMQDLVRLRAQRAPPAVRTAAAAGWSRCWWGVLSVAVQQAVAGTALGRAWPAQPQAGPGDGPGMSWGWRIWAKSATRP